MFLSAITQRRRSDRPAAAAHELTVFVHGGYDPDVLHARAGEPIRIAFVREETAPCSERVVFPAFGKNAMLPYRQRVVVELPPAAAGSYEFTCAMEMLRGTLIVEEAR